MSKSMNMDQLMMDALDGAVDAQQRRILREYLSQHPQERALFERMQSIDALMRSEPVSALPPALTHQVMNAIPRQRIERVTLRWPQIIFIILAASLIAVFIAVVMVVLYALIQPMLPVVTASSIFALLRSLFEAGVSLLGELFAFGRVAITQPVTWVVMAAAMCIVAVWLRIVVGALLPGTTTARA